MESKNMKCKRPGSKPVHFGTCSTAKALKRYARLEGFAVGAVMCCGCRHQWTMIVPPEKLPLKLVPGIQSFKLPDQPCVNCKLKRVIFTINYKP